MTEQQLELFPPDEVPAISRPPRPALTAADSLMAALEPFTVYMRQKEFSANTIKSFLSDLRLLAEFLGEETPLARCSTQKLEDFLRHLQEDRPVPCAPKSLARRITTLKVFFGWLAANEVLATDPALPLASRPARSPLPHILSEEQSDRLLALTRSMRDAERAPDARPHLLVTLVLTTGIKKAECMGIALEHLDLSHPERPAVYIHYAKPRQQFKARLLALPEDFPQTLEIYLRRYQPKQYLFECTARNLEYVLHTLSTLAGLREQLTFEMLRWTSAVRSFRAGMDAEHLRKKLGLSLIAWRETLPIIEKLAAGPL
jgi:site-specific recombinase XerD